MDWTQRCDCLKEKSKKKLRKSFAQILHGTSPEWLIYEPIGVESLLILKRWTHSVKPRQQLAVGVFLGALHYPHASKMTTHGKLTPR